MIGHRLIPPPTVEVARVIAVPENMAPSPAHEAPGSTTSLFQASGWIEPAPSPVHVPAMIDAVVAEVHVHPGDSVERGRLLVSLVDDDVRLAHEHAKLRHRAASAALKVHQAGIDAAEMELARLSAELAVAEARLAEADDRSDRLGNLPDGAVPRAEVVAARLAHQRELARKEAASSAVERMRADLRTLEVETEQKRAECDAAEVEVKQGALALRRTRITSPIDGRVLRLLAEPGQKKIFNNDDPEGSTLVILYHPDQLQVRVDVPLADAAALQIGQSARIICSLLPDLTLNGKVTHIQGEADIQRNTLQAKVRILDPAGTLRPDMLCRVEFLQAQIPASPQGSRTSLGTWIPERALSGGSVWVCDPETGRVNVRVVTPGTGAREGYIRIIEGLQPGEWVVLDPADMREGMRINPKLIEP